MASRYGVFFGEEIAFAALNMPKYLHEAGTICQYSNKCSINHFNQHFTNNSWPAIKATN